MKALLTIIAVLFFNTVFAQWQPPLKQRTFTVAPNETWVLESQVEYLITFVVAQTGERFTVNTDIVHYFFETASRTMFDSDGRIEILEAYLEYGFFRPPTFRVVECEIRDGRLSTIGSENISGDQFLSVEQETSGAVLYFRYDGIDSPDLPQGSVERLELPGNTPDYDKRLLSMSAPITTTDTVYINNTITRVDTVYQFVYDTVYNFTEQRIYVEGNVDTVYNETRIIEENKIVEERVTRDSVYLLGGDYLKHQQVVTGLPRIKVETLKAYPNPASETITFAVHTGENYRNGLALNIYDINGRQVESVSIASPFDDITINVRSYDPGMYVYMVYSNSGKSTSKKFIVL